MEQYIETATGKHYHFLSPKPEDIDIEDIAVALANKCRFGGHSRFFSVAEHSVCVAYRLPKELRLAGLLHDAAEAYLGDIPSPIKHVLPDYQHLERLNEYAIEEKFGIELNVFERAQIKFADVEALCTEAHFLIPSQGKTWSMFADGKAKVSYEFKPQCLPPAHAHKLFIETFRELTGASPQLRLIGV